MGSLADYVPIDTRLYLELTDTDALGRTQAGAALGRVLGWLAAEVGPPSLEPGATLFESGGLHEGSVITGAAGERGGVPDSWAVADSGTANAAETFQDMLVQALGLSSRQAGLLVDGPVAVAADGWQYLPSGVLLARPRNPAALEASLEDRRLPGPTDAPVRRYRLAFGHELTSDGRVAIVGRGQDGSDLYSRSTQLLRSARGLCLSDLAEFRERMAEIPAGAQGVFYVGTHLRSAAGEPTHEGWWALLAPPVRSLAVALSYDDKGLAVETTGYLRTADGTLGVREPPIESLLFLPASTLAAWTSPIQYVKHYDRLKTQADGMSRFYLDLLEWQMEPDALRKRLLAHLKGDTVVAVGAVNIPISIGWPADAQEASLPVPTVALLVRTDEPQEVLATMRALADNIIRLANLMPGDREDRRIESMPIGETSETRVFSVDLSGLFLGMAVRPFQEALQLSWCVTDGHLIVGTHARTVSEIVQARWGAIPLMPAEAVQQAMSRQRPPRRLPDRVLVAQPRAASAMIDSWLTHVAAHHPEMLEEAWWQRMRRRYWATQVQLGIRPAPDMGSGGIRVTETLAGWPAHGRLEVGDRIIAVDGRALDPERALDSLKIRLAMRTREDRVVLDVIRQGQARQVTIPMPVTPSPTVHPLALLQEIADLARTFQFASYVAWHPSRGIVQTRLDLRLPSPRVSPAVVRSPEPAEPPSSDTTGTITPR